MTGAPGLTLPELRPLGRMEMDTGQRHEVRAWTGVIPAGTRVEVIRLEPGNLVVRTVDT